VDGSTSSQSRDHAVASTVKRPVSADAKKPVVAGPLGKEKFGVQAATPKSIILFRNGDKHHTGEKIPPGKFKMLKTMDQVGGCVCVVCDDDDDDDDDVCVCVCV
jgi:ribosomal protein L27